MLYHKRRILLKKKTSQKLRNCPNSRYSKYSRIVKFGQDCEILAFSGNFSITYILYEFSMIICTINIALWRCSLNVFVIVFVFCICLRRCLFVGQVMFSHHSAQMSQSSKVSNIALWRCSLNVFVIVFVIVIVLVFVVVFLLVRSCFLIALIKCLKGQKYQRLLFEGVL